MTAAERQALLDRARAGDADALGQLLGDFRPYVRVVAHALHGGRLRGRVEDSDLIQDALLEAHRGFAAFRGRSVEQFTAWLRQIVAGTVSHALRTYLGTAKRDPARELPGAVLTAVADRSSSPVAEAVRHEEAARIARLLDRLPEDMQQVLLGRFVEDLPHAVLAERLGRSEAAVRMLYLRALRRLREEVEADHE